jgi:hypothetical protein
MSERIESAFRRGTPVDRAMAKSIRKAVLGAKGK